MPAVNACVPDVLLHRDTFEGEIPVKDRVLHTLLKQRFPVNFDLSAGPLVHVALLQLDSMTQMLYMCIHHIVSDGFPMGVLVRDNCDTKAWQVFTADVQRSTIHILPGNHLKLLSAANARSITMVLNAIG